MIENKNVSIYVNSLQQDYINLSAEKMRLCLIVGKIVIKYPIYFALLFGLKEIVSWL